MWQFCEFRSLLGQMDQVAPVPASRDRVSAEALLRREIAARRGSNARRAVATALRADDRFAELELGHAIKCMADRRVFSATWRGQDAIVKHVVTPDRDARISAMRDEILAVRTLMSQGRLRVADHLVSSPEAGILVTERAPGVSLTRTLMRAEPVRRARLLLDAGRWLRRYCSPRRDFRPFHPATMLMPPLDLSDNLAAEDRDRVAFLEGYVAAKSAEFAGAPVLYAASHGDFIARNLHFSAGDFWGFDLDHETWMPIARDAAHFLTMLQLRDKTGKTEFHYGIDAADYWAFLDSGAVPARELDSILPIFLAQSMLAEIPLPDKPKHSLLLRLRLMIDGFRRQVG